MSEHPSLEELLAVRDGEGSAAARQHVERCPACGAELERLHQVAAALRALPALRAPRDRWPAVRAALEAARRRQQWTRAGWVALAAAAAVVLVVGLRSTRQGQDAALAERASLDSLVAESQRLEEALRLLDPTSRVLSGRVASSIAELEDRIALLDARLDQAQQERADPAAIRRLWQERVLLMSQLVNLHVTRAAYVGL
jgi:DNA repair exonuclease SbcCD ATPase subunit